MREELESAGLGRELGRGTKRGPVLGFSHPQLMKDERIHLTVVGGVGQSARAKGGRKHCWTRKQP